MSVSNDIALAGSYDEQPSLDQQGQQALRTVAPTTTVTQLDMKGEQHPSPQSAPGLVQIPFNINDGGGDFPPSATMSLSPTSTFEGHQRNILTCYLTHNPLAANHSFGWITWLWNSIRPEEPELVDGVRWESGGGIRGRLLELSRTGELRWERERPRARWMLGVVVRNGHFGKVARARDAEDLERLRSVRREWKKGLVL